MSEGDRLDSREITREVIELLEPELAAGGFDLLDVRVFQGGGRSQIRVYVDTLEGGIDLGQCTKASRTVGMLLEEADLIADQYVIEVSSPGVRRPLRKVEHFEAAVGQKVDLRLLGSDGPRRVRGILQEVSGSQVVVVRDEPAVAEGAAEGTADGAEEAAPAADPESLVVTVDLHRIREASLDPDFDAQALINADRRRRREEKRNKRREKSGKGRKKFRPKAKKEDKSSTPGSESGGG
jgi:ribosome maturation factor RimP